jgi:hypothetical protein
MMPKKKRIMLKLKKQRVVIGHKDSMKYKKVLEL